VVVFNQVMTSWLWGFVRLLKSFQAVPEYYVGIRQVFPRLSSVYQHSLCSLMIIKSLMLYRLRSVAAGNSRCPWCIRVELY
jgi:hypothetical protein